MSKIQETIGNWTKTQQDKTQAKLDVTRVLTWVESLNADLKAIADGTEKLPVMPPNVPAFANTIAVRIQSDIDTAPENLPATIKDMNLALGNVIAALTDEIAAHNAPDANATDSEIATINGMNEVLKLAQTKPLHETVQAMAKKVKETCGYVPKIKAEAIAAFLKANPAAAAAIEEEQGVKN